MVAYQTRGETMRGIDGPCGHYLEAKDDEALVEEMKIHAVDVHPELDMTVDQIRELVANGARDA
jgi:predicted small metal-binding protein